MSRFARQTVRVYSPSCATVPNDRLYKKPEWWFNCFSALCKLILSREEVSHHYRRGSTVTISTLNPVQAMHPHNITYIALFTINYPVCQCLPACPNSSNSSATHCPSTLSNGITQVPQGHYTDHVPSFCLGTRIDQQINVLYDHQTSNVQQLHWHHAYMSANNRTIQALFTALQHLVTRCSVPTWH